MTDRPISGSCIFLEDPAQEAARVHAADLPNTPVDHVPPILTGMELVPWRRMGAPSTSRDGNAGFEPRHDHSIAVTSRDRPEIDRLWAASTEGGSEGRRGLLRDRFGIRRQIGPTEPTRKPPDPDREADGRAQAARMAMTRIDVASMSAPSEGRA